MLSPAEREQLRAAHGLLVATAAAYGEALRAAAAGEPGADDATVGTQLRMTRARSAFLALLERRRGRASVAELADALGTPIATLDALLADQALARAQDRRTARRRWVGAARAARWARVPLARPQSTGRRRRPRR